MEKPTVEVTVPDVEVVIRFNPVTRNFSLSGCDDNPVIAWGMLKYAESRLRRALAESDMLHKLQNASRLSLPGGPLA